MIVDTSVHFIGIDVSKKTLQIFDEKSKENVSIVNTPDAIGDYFRSKPNEEIIVVFEPTGVYHTVLEHTLASMNINAFKIPPYQSSKYFSLLSKNKTDRQDAKSLVGMARMIQTNGEQFNLVLHPISPKYVGEMNAKLGVIHMLKNERKLMKQHLESMKNNCLTDFSELIKSHQETIDNIDKEIAGQMKEIVAILTKHQHEKQLTNLQTIPGVGPIVALELIIFYITMFYKGLKKKDSKRVVAHTGLHPTQKQSGQSSYTHLSKIGDKQVRTIATIVGTQSRKHVKKAQVKQELGEDVDTTNSIVQFGWRLSKTFASKSRPVRATIAAMAHKLIKISRAMFCDNTEFRLLDQACH